MAERDVHCPFLNRADARCSTHFSLETLDNAFEECFGEYHQCPTYAELLVERRVRQAGERVLIKGHAHARSSFVQLRLPVERPAYAKSVA